MFAAGSFNASPSSNVLSVKPISVNLIAPTPSISSTVYCINWTVTFPSASTALTATVYVPATPGVNDAPAYV